MGRHRLGQAMIRAQATPAVAASTETKAAMAREGGFRIVFVFRVQTVFVGIVASIGWSAHVSCLYLSCHVSHQHFAFTRIHTTAATAATAAVCALQLWTSVHRDILD